MFSLSFWSVAFRYRFRVHTFLQSFAVANRSFNSPLLAVSFGSPIGHCCFKGFDL